MDSSESPKPVDNSVNVPGIAVSPSLHSLVTQVRKGYDDVLKDTVSSKLRLGVSSLVQEVRSLNRSYREMGSGTIFGEDLPEHSSQEINEDDWAFQLDTGQTGAILDESWWLKERDVRDAVLEVTLSTCTLCPNCRTMIYDEEIMAGWKVYNDSLLVMLTVSNNLIFFKVDDQNLNTICPHCYADEESSGNLERKGTPHIIGNFIYKTPNISVAFVSPLVLRRELETLLAADRQALKSHPVIYWNLIYYLRRLALPTYLYSWISPRYHIRCVYDRPFEHTGSTPLYFLNPNHQSVQDNKLFAAIQTLVNESRRVTDNGQISIGSHFPIFRYVTVYNIKFEIQSSHFLEFFFQGYSIFKHGFVWSKSDA
uniref:Autophagy protein 5 n=1 Tax=Heterorhabditis bacteriophora TaxID=37862 RepID=A0A1I7XSG7_HETBA